MVNFFIKFLEDFLNKYLKILLSFKSHKRVSSDLNQLPDRKVNSKKATAIARFNSFSILYIFCFILISCSGEPQIGEQQLNLLISCVN